MVAHHGAVDQVFHAPGPQHLPRHPPEHPSVVPARAEPPEEPQEDRGAAPDARGSQARRIQGKAPSPPEGVALVIGVAGVEELRGVGRPNAPPPHLEHCLLGQPEPDVRLARGVLEQPPLAGQPLPERRLGERVQDVDRQDRDLRGPDELKDVVGRLGGVRVEPEDDARHHLQAVAVDPPHGLHDRQPKVLLLGHRAQGRRLGRLDAAEDRDEPGLPHQGQDALVLRDVEGRLAREAEGIAVPRLPRDEVREQLERGLLVADEVVVDEVDRLRAARAEAVQLGEHLRRLLEAGIPSVQRRDVTELAGVWAPARELDAREEVLAQGDELIGWDREVVERQPRRRGEGELAPRASAVRVEVLDDAVRRVAHFADVQDVGRRVRLGTP